MVLIGTVTLFVSVAVPIVLLVVGLIANKLKAGEFNNKSVKEMTDYIVSHREKASESAEDKLAFVLKWQKITNAYSAVLLLCGLLIGVCGGMILDESYVAAVFCSALLLITVFTRIHGKEEPVSDIIFADEAEYPEIYSVARGVMDKLGYSAELKIAFIAGNNAGIYYTENDGFNVLLGIILLKTFNKKELENVFIHEFAHYYNVDKRKDHLASHYDWITSGGQKHFFSGLTKVFYKYFDNVFLLNYDLYSYASSLMKEEEADRLVKEIGDTQYAASGFLKLHFHDMFCWERGTYDYEVHYPEELDKRSISLEIDEFLARKALQEEKWIQLAGEQIISRSASHPTVKMRIASLGVSEYRVFGAEEDEAYNLEVQHALEFIEELVYNDRVETYADERNEEYLKPLEQVSKWEEDGKKLEIHTYAGIVNSLRSLGRNTEAESVCLKAMEIFEGEAKAYAFFMHGNYLIRRYDVSGIEYIYKAMNSNSNYIEGGLDAIGHFCCLTGNQELLDEYRNRATEIQQRYVDVYSQMEFIDKNDVLVREELPESIGEGVIGHIKSINSEKLNRVLLMRKVITEDFFASVVVLEFVPDVSDDERARVHRSMFEYLDALDWQFTLFDYSDIPSGAIEKFDDNAIYERG